VEFQRNVPSGGGDEGGELFPGVFKADGPVSLWGPFLFRAKVNKEIVSEA
jgi:hypothetical protein